jgi:D-alanyl-D-alanine carboxypeptidase/D-alanyl-D-alanine-endopeptidase (penicillin-binding protein 4)
LCTQGFLEQELPTPGEGTLSKRMLYLKNYVHAKTGTLSNISSIAGYITTQKGQKYVFCIMINNSEIPSADKKMLEEYILRTLYTKG